MSDSSASIFARLGAKMSLSKITEAITKLSTGRNGAFGSAKDISFANTLKAQAASQNAAGNNLRTGIAALTISESSLNEISALTTRLAEIGTLHTNNSLLSNGKNPLRVKYYE